MRVAPRRFQQRAGETTAQKSHSLWGVAMQFAQSHPLPSRAMGRVKVRVHSDQGEFGCTQAPLMKQKEAELGFYGVSESPHAEYGEECGHHS